MKFVHSYDEVMKLDEPVLSDLVDHVGSFKVPSTVNHEQNRVIPVLRASQQLRTELCASSA